MLIKKKINKKIKFNKNNLDNRLQDNIFKKCLINTTKKHLKNC